MGRREQQIKTMKRNSHDGGKRNLTERQHILFINMDLSWGESEVLKAIDLWNEDKSIVEMASILRPRLDHETAQWETLLLLIELIRTDKIEDRGTGILGMT